jgi:sirohydrochlorin cobaltochelatase
MKKAILWVAFGSSAPEARKVFDQIEAQTRRAVPAIAARWVYTSRSFRMKLAKQEKRLDSSEVVLARLIDNWLPCRGTHP